MATFCQEPFFQSFPFGLARYELIVDADNNPVNYRILCCNSAFCELFGFSAAEMEGKTILEIIPQPNPVIKAGFECFGRVAMNNENESFEYYSERRRQWFQVQVYAEGKGVITSVFFDITDRKEQEEIIRLNEEKYHTLFESMALGVFYQAADGKIIDANDASLRMLGLNRNQFLGTDSFDPRWKVINKQYEVIPPSQHPSMKALQTGCRIKEEIVGVYIPEKDCYHWLIVDVIPQFLPGSNKPYQVFASMQDITSIKEAEESLLYSHSMLKIAGKTAKFGGWSLKADTKEVTWSDEVASIHEMPVGFSPDLEQGIKYYSPEFRPVISRVLEECLENGTPFDEILQIITSRGKQIWVRATGLAIRDAMNKIVQVQGSFQDIHDIKIAENRLQDAKNYAENLIQTANAIVVGMDILGNIHTFNSTAEKITGYTFAEIKELNWFETLCPREKYPQVWEIFTKTAEGKLPRVFENPILTRDGVEMIIQWHNSEIIEHDEIKGSISFGIDVTERRIAEKINEVRLRLIQFSLDHTLDELLEKMLNEAENLTKSKIGFVHFVEDDQENLILQNWSERTKKDYCKAEGKGAHYSIAKAGVWVDCVHVKKPVIHNDYASLPHRKGLPEGHAEVIREIVVPVIRSEKIKAILGVGNKEENYNQQDVDTLLSIANLTWDIAERLSAEQNFHEIEERFHKVFDIAPIGMVLLDAAFNCIQANSSFTEFSGISLIEIDQIKFTDLTVLDSQELESIQKVISGEVSVYSKEIRFIRPDNQTVWGSLQMTAIQDVDKGFRYLLTMIDDVNDRKQYEAEILRINAELKEAIETKDKFFSIIAHDLRSPFNNIIGLSDLLKSEVRNFDSKQIENFAGLISKSAGHTLQLIDNLLSWARMQQGRMSFSPGNLLLKNFVKDVVWILNEGALQKNITIHNKIPPKMIIHADENMITGIIRNLISNAIKFTNAGGSVEISAQFEENQVVVSVADTGVGIPDHQIEKLFHVGTNSSTRGTANETGTGLGLILCREFVEKHGGKIWVKSTAGQGTAFYFSIPDDSDAVS